MNYINPKTVHINLLVRIGVTALIIIELKDVPYVIPHVQIVSPIKNSLGELSAYGIDIVNKAEWIKEAVDVVGLSS